MNHHECVHVCEFPNPFLCIIFYIILHRKGEFFKTLWAGKKDKLRMCTRMQISQPVFMHYYYIIYFTIFYIENVNISKTKRVGKKDKFKSSHIIEVCYGLLRVLIAGF